MLVDLLEYAPRLRGRLHLVESFDLDGTRSVPLGVEAAYTTVASYTMPKNRAGVIVGLGVEVYDTAYTYDGSIAWRLTIDNSPVETFGDFTQQRGRVLALSDVWIPVRPGLPIAFAVRRAVAAAGAQRVGMRFLGLKWPDDCQPKG